MELTREENLYMAKLADRAKRKEDMIEFMGKVTAAAMEEGPAELTLEERKLLSVSYKNVVTALRESWRITSSIEYKEECRGNYDHVVAIREFRHKIERDLRSTCGGILHLLNTYILPSASTPESKVFYLKSKGDYHRYLAEIQTGDDQIEDIDSAITAYTSGQRIASVWLPPSYPVRLGLALNFSVFHREILNSRYNACQLAKESFDEAVSEMNNLGDEHYKETTLLLQLLHDNLTMWKSDMLDEEEDIFKDSKKRSKRKENKKKN